MEVLPKPLHTNDAQKRPHRHDMRMLAVRPKFGSTGAS